MHATHGPVERPERDPVCGRELPDGQAPLRADMRGRTSVFCSERCRTLFLIRPGWFVGRGTTARRAS